MGFFLPSRTRAINLVGLSYFRIYINISHLRIVLFFAVRSEWCYEMCVFAQIRGNNNYVDFGEYVDYYVNHINI